MDSFFSYSSSYELPDPELKIPDLDQQHCMWHGHAVWTCSAVIRHGHSARTCSSDMQH
jgi:hypothetical protein